MNFESKLSNRVTNTVGTLGVSDRVALKSSINGASSELLGGNTVITISNTLELSYLELNVIIRTSSSVYIGEILIFYSTNGNYSFKYNPKCGGNINEVINKVTYIKTDKIISFGIIYNNPSNIIALSYKYNLQGNDIIMKDDVDSTKVTSIVVIEQSNKHCDGSDLDSGINVSIENEDMLGSSNILPIGTIIPFIPYSNDKTIDKTNNINELPIRSLLVENGGNWAICDGNEHEGYRTPNLSGYAPVGTNDYQLLNLINTAPVTSKLVFEEDKTNDRNNGSLTSNGNRKGSLKLNGTTIMGFGDNTDTTSHEVTISSTGKSTPGVFTYYLIKVK